MEPITIIIIIAIVSVIAVLVLSSKRRGAGADEEYDEDEYDEEEELDIEEADEDGGEYEEDYGEEYANEEPDADAEEDDDEYYVEEASFESYKATVVGMDVERHHNGSAKYPKSNLCFLVEFKIHRSRKKAEVITLDVPEEIYEDIRLGENALLVLQNGHFIDFGDRYAEEAPEDAIKQAEQEKEEARNAKKSSTKKKK
jgi:hypothetical protein